MGQIGAPVRHREYEPLPEHAPAEQPVTAPAEPAREPEPVPA